MNKRVYFIILVGVALIALANVSSAANFERNLSYGLSNNPDVRELQKFLTNAGYFKGTATGNFYDLTCAALKNFQVANGINPTCNFGPLTRAAVMKNLAGNTTPKITLLSPQTGDAWEYDKKYSIEYTAEGVARLGFEVRNGNKVVYRTEAPIPAGSGIGFNVNPYYREKMGEGPNFSVRLFDWDKPEVYAESNGSLNVGVPAAGAIAQTPAPRQTAPAPSLEDKTSKVAELSTAVQALLENIRNQVEALRQLRGL